MKKIVPIQINETRTEVTIRRVKMGELRELAAKIAANLDGAAASADGITGLSSLFLDVVTDDIILKFTDLTREKLDEIDVYDVYSLVQTLIAWNGLSIKAAADFLGRTAGAASPAEEWKTAVIPQ